MKKNLLIAAILLLSMSGQAFCAEKPINNTESEIEQKACQNVFSLINIDLSFMSPRATLTDSNVDASTAPKPPKYNDGIVPITNKKDMRPCPPPPPRKDDKMVPAAYRKDMPPCPPPNCEAKGPEPCPCCPKPEQRNKTSLFRLDLLHLFKIQIL